MPGLPGHGSCGSSCLQNAMFHSAWGAQQPSLCLGPLDRRQHKSPVHAGAALLTAWRAVTSRHAVPAGVPWPVVCRLRLHLLRCNSL